MVSFMPWSLKNFIYLYNKPTNAHVQSHIIMLNQHVSANPVTIIRVSYNQNTINPQYTIYKQLLQFILRERTARNHSKGGGVIFNSGCGCYGEDKILAHARNQAQIPRSSSQQPSNYSACVISAYDSQIIRLRLTNRILVTIRTECRSYRRDISNDTEKSGLMSDLCRQMARKTC